MDSFTVSLHGVEIQLLLLRNELVDSARQKARAAAGQWGSQGYFERYEAAWPDGFDEMIKQLDAICDALAQAKDLLEGE